MSSPSPTSGTDPRPVAVPDDIDDPRHQKVTGVVQLPSNVGWSGPAKTYDLDDPVDRARVYEQVLREGTDDDVRRRGGGASYDAALDRWDTSHAGPLLERAVPPDVAELVTRLRRAVSSLAVERPLAAGAVLDELDRWQAALRARNIGVASRAPTVRERLDALAASAAPVDRRLGR